tara:strand:+ start:228 stop:542 length:315 start_codon:yes stop_codon:yes gene_type:complete
MSYLPLEMCTSDLTDTDTYVKIRVHQQFSTDSEIYEFIKRHSLRKKDVKKGWRDNISKAFRNIKEAWEFDRLINIVLSFENRTYGFDKADQRFLIERRKRRTRR